MNSAMGVVGGTLDHRPLKWIAFAFLSLTGATLLVGESAHLRKTLSRVLQAPACQSNPVPFGSVPSRPLHDDSPAQLLDEIHSMAQRNVATEDIIDQITIEHLQRPTLNLRLKLRVAVHKHDSTGLELEARGLAGRHLSTQEIVERLLQHCSE